MATNRLVMEGASLLDPLKRMDVVQGLCRFQWVMSRTLDEDVIALE